MAPERNEHKPVGTSQSLQLSASDITKLSEDAVELGLFSTNYEVLEGLVTFHSNGKEQDLKLSNRNLP